MERASGGFVGLGGQGSLSKVEESLELGPKDKMGFAMWKAEGEYSRAGQSPQGGNGRPNLPTTPTAEFCPRANMADSGPWSAKDVYLRLGVSSQDLTWVYLPEEPRAQNRAQGPSSLFALGNMEKRTNHKTWRQPCLIGVLAAWGPPQNRSTLVNLGFLICERGR